MPHWSQNIPPDPRRRLKNVTGYRPFGPQDLWGEIREWLIARSVALLKALPNDARH